MNHIFSADGTRLSESTVEYESFGGGIIGPINPLNSIEATNATLSGQPAMSQKTYAGSYEFTMGQPKRLLLSGGYLTLSDNIYHHYITDYQGNVVLVINTQDRSIEQQTGYYPYGMPHGDAVGADAQPNKYSGKRLQTFAGMDTYDFHARQLPIGIPRFDRPDRLSEDFYHINPYIYCQGDPINYLDQTGDSLYKVNQVGKIMSVEKNDIQNEDGTMTEGPDVVEIYDNKGQSTGKSITFPAKTIERGYGELNWYGHPFSLFRVRGDEYGQALFEFLAINLRVEFSRCAMGLPGRRGLNFITTSHQLDEEWGIVELFNGQLRYGYHARIFDHNHPRNTEEPGKGDYILQGVLQRTFGKFIKTRIFIPRKGIYINY